MDQERRIRYPELRKIGNVNELTKGEEDPISREPGFNSDIT